MTVPVEFDYGMMRVSIDADVEAMARRAAGDAASAIADAIAERGQANVVFSGAESQQAFHRALRKQTIEWSQVRAFAVDEFLEAGLPSQYAVGAQPQRDLYDHVPIGRVHHIDAHANPERERDRYERLVRQHPPDLACLGIGISGHVALNEPDDTDFDDEADVRLATLCDASVRQLERDPNFSTLPRIPHRGLTVTLAALMRTPRIVVVVPYQAKAAIIARLFQAAPTAALPASILQRHPRAWLYLDRESFSLCNDAPANADPT